MAIGASDNGSYGRPNPDHMAKIKGNIFYKCYNTSDHDASIFATWEDNKWIEQDLLTISGFARHFPSKYINNYIYNANCKSSTPPPEYGVSAIVCNPDGLEFTNNTIIDDRLLPNPTTAPVLTQVSGGSMASRTYYVKYTYVNDTGETVASSESNLTVSANNLLKASIPTSVATYFVPYGAKSVRWYISTTTSTQKYQGYMATPWQWETELEAGTRLPAAELFFTEPTTGLLSLTISAVDTTNNFVTVSSTSALPTGTPVRITSTGTFLGGLSAATTYYVIKLTSTTISLATTLANAQAGTGIDITSAGSGTRIIEGAPVPGSNTTHRLTQYGIYELAGVDLIPNIYENNKFYGIATEIIKASGATRIARNNYTNRDISNDNTQLLEAMPYSQGSVTGATTFNVANGEKINATLTGNITITLSNGEYTGQKLSITLTQDATGSRTATWPSNFKKAGGTLILSSGANTLDVINIEYNGTNWVETSRIMGLS